MAISEQWAELLEPGLREIFYLQREALAAASKIPMLFNTGLGSGKAQEHFLSIGAMADWEAYKGAIEYDSFDQGYKTTLTHEEYIKGFKVQRKLVDDDQYEVISARPRQLALSATRTREKHAASVFTNAFSSSYVGGDAVSLCNDSHPYGPENATVQDNKGTSALSYDTVVSTRRLMREYKDDRGELVTISPDTLLVPPELEEEAATIWRTMNKPDTADYHANFVQGFLRNVIVWDYLTEAKDWFLIDGTLGKIHLLWIDRIGMEFEMDPTSDFRLEARFRGYMRYSYGWSDWRWCYGHDVT